jgi:hypothetical protein
MGDALLPFPLTERSVHLCVDMQRIFSADGPWPSPWMERVLPVVATLAARHPERPLADVGASIARQWFDSESRGLAAGPRARRSSCFCAPNSLAISQSGVRCTPEFSLRHTVKALSTPTAKIMPLIADWTSAARAR